MACGEMRYMKKLYVMQSRHRPRVLGALEIEYLTQIKVSVSLSIGALNSVLSSMTFRNAF